MHDHEPSGADDTIAAIERAFARTPHPGAAFLQGSHDGCEPAEAVRPFREVTDWRAIEPAWLDTHYTALSFLSEGRPFERSGGGATLLNPRRYGAMTFEDSARYRLSVFCREEVLAIVAYLEHRRGTAELDMTHEAIDAALAAFWHPRSTSAPVADALDAHVATEFDFVRAITARSEDQHGD